MRARSFRHLSAILLLITGVLSTTTTSRAQPAGLNALPPAAPNDIEGKRARELFTEGVKAYRKSKWAEAHTFFLGAWELKKHWQIAANMGDCEMQLGRYREAAEHLWYYAREAPPEKKAEAAAFLKKAQEKVGTISVKVDVLDAEVLVDGLRVGSSPMSEPVFVEPGAKTIAARAAGMPLAEKKLEVMPGSEHAVTLTLTPERKPEAKPPSEANGTKGTEQKTTKGAMPLPLVIGGAAVAAIGLGMGIGFTVAANGKSDEAAAIRDRLGGPSVCYGQPPLDRAADCSAVLEAGTSADTYTRVAISGYVIGLASGMATAGLVLLWPKATLEKRTGSVAAIPWAGPQSAGVTLAGAF